MTSQKQKYIELKSAYPFGKAYLRGKCQILVGQEPNVGWHLSISHPKRNPTWEEIRDARYDLIPDEVRMAMFLPPKDEYVNIHDRCFHLFQVFDDKK